MKFLSLVFLIFAGLLQLKAQLNLVPNFSFEQYDTCPNNEDRIHFASGWSKYSATITTPDYYNGCSSASAFGVPQSTFCYQPERRGCDAYAGLVTFDPNGYRECIGIQLSGPLVIGQKYYLSLYVVMDGLELAGDYYGMPSNNIGMRLSTIAYSPSTPAPIDNWAHHYSSVILTDTVSWMLLSGSIIADSAYNYLIIGNFFDNNSTDTSHYNCGTCMNFGSYYLIDDICLSTDSIMCNGGLNLLQCDVSTHQNENGDGVNIFPNPVIDFLTVTLPESSLNAQIELWDVLGQNIWNTTASTNLIELNLSLYPQGTYFLIIKDENDEIVTIKKILKQ